MESMCSLPRRDRRADLRAARRRLGRKAEGMSMRILLREQNRYKIKLEKEKLCRRRASQEEMEATKLQQQQSRLKRKMNQQQKSVSTTRHAEVENDHDGNEEDESNQVNCTSAQLINHPHAVKRLRTASPILTSASIPAASASTQHKSQPHPQSQPTHPVTAIVLHGPRSSSRSIPCPACSASFTTPETLTQHFKQQPSCLTRFQQTMLASAMFVQSNQSHRSVQ